MAVDCRNVNGRHIRITGHQSCLISQVRCGSHDKIAAIKTPTCAGLSTLTTVNYHVIMCRLLFLIMLLSTESFILSKYSFRPIYENKCYCRAHQNNTRSVFVKYTRSLVFTLKMRFSFAHMTWQANKFSILTCIIANCNELIFQGKFGKQNVELCGGVFAQSQVRPGCLYLKRNRD